MFTRHIVSRCVDRRYGNQHLTQWSGRTQQLVGLHRGKKLSDLVTHTTTQHNGLRRASRVALHQFYQQVSTKSVVKARPSN